MALVKKARVKETSTTTGTGTYTLAGAVAGFQAFSVIGDGNTCHYHATDGTDWEDGVGTYTLSGTTLARTTILESSNAGAAVNWGAGTRTLTVVYPASKAVTLDGTETLTNKTLTAPTMTTPALGTPASGTLTNCAGLPLAGVLSVGKGTSFPGSPASGDQFFRTDIGYDCYYDGTRWLTKHEYALSMPLLTALQPDVDGVVTSDLYAVPDFSQAGVWLTRWIVDTYIGTNDGSNYITAQLKSINTTGTLTSVGSSFTTAADTASRHVIHVVTLGVSLASTEKLLAYSATKTGSPADSYITAQIVYRLIVT